MHILMDVVKHKHDAIFFSIVKLWNSRFLKFELVRLNWGSGWCFPLFKFLLKDTAIWWITCYFKTICSQTTGPNQQNETICSTETTFIIPQCELGHLDRERELAMLRYLEGTDRIWGVDWGWGKWFHRSGYNLCQPRPPLDIYHSVLLLAS